MINHLPYGSDNISLKESSVEDSQISSNDETSLNNNIHNFYEKKQIIFKGENINKLHKRMLL